VDAIKLEASGSILMSFDYPLFLPYVGPVGDEDIVRFTPTMLFINFSYADAVDDATVDDVDDLCNNKPAIPPACSPH